MQTGQWTTREIAERARASGFDWVAIEMDDFGNDARWPSFRAECVVAGVTPGVWYTEGANIANTPGDAAFTIAEVEGPGDYDGVLAAPTPIIPHAIITNFSTVTDERAAPLIERGYACITEAYTNVLPSITPDSMDNSARWRGWAYTIPCFGIWDAPLSLYDQWRAWPYGWCVYLGEHIL